MKNFLKITPRLFIACIIFSLNASGVTRKSVASGNWNNAATWNTPGVPACGDSVVIQATHTVSLTNQQNYSACIAPLKIAIYGSLIFFNGSKLSLPCGSYIIVYPGGVIKPDVGLSNSNFVEICDNVEWNSNAILNGLACLPPSHPFCLKILPVELTSFTAETCNENKICLNWETATESNNDHYEIQRTPDAVDFKTLLSIPSKATNGNSQYKISYNGTDETPLDGIGYYRLKQVDKDNTFTYSKIISADFKKEDGLQFLIFPNSNSGEFTAKISGLKNPGIMSILLKDASGAYVHKVLQHVDDGISLIRIIPASQLPGGFYFCSFIIDDKEHVVRMVVENN